MKKLSAAQRKRREELIAKLNEASTELANALEKYNAVREEANHFAQEVVEAQEEYLGLRSERWQESEEGSAYQEWKEAWDNAVVELDEPIEDASTESQVAALENAPEEV